MLSYHRMSPEPMSSCQDSYHLHTSSWDPQPTTTEAATMVPLIDTVQGGWEQGTPTFVQQGQ